MIVDLRSGHRARLALPTVAELAMADLLPMDLVAIALSFHPERPLPERDTAADIVRRFHATRALALGAVRSLWDPEREAWDEVRLTAGDADGISAGDLEVLERAVFRADELAALAAIVATPSALVIGGAAQRFSTRPSAVLGIEDDVVALAFDVAIATRLGSEEARADQALAQRLGGKGSIPEGQAYESAWDAVEGGPRH